LNGYKNNIECYEPLFIPDKSLLDGLLYQNKFNYLFKNCNHNIILIKINKLFQLFKIYVHLKLILLQNATFNWPDLTIESNF